MSANSFSRFVKNQHQAKKSISLIKLWVFEAERAKKHKQSYTYLVHGKYLRDASEAQLEATIQRICGLATEVRANLMVTIASVPPGASLEKANYVFKRVEEYGRY